MLGKIMSSDEHFPSCQDDDSGFWGFELRLTSTATSAGDLPTEGRSLVIVADLMGVLYFRIFETDGKKVVDTSEARLQVRNKSAQIASLRSILSDLWDRPRISGVDESVVIAAVTSLVGYFRKFEPIDHLDPTVNYAIWPIQMTQYRQQFLDAIQEHAPEVLEALHTLWTRGRTRPAEPSVRFPRPMDPVVEWAKRFHLYEEDFGTGDWFVEAGRRTIQFWDAHPDSTGTQWSEDAAEVSLTERGSDAFPRGRHEQRAIAELLATPRQFAYPPWDPRKQLWDDYEKERIADLRSELLREKDQLKAQWFSPRSKEPPEKRAKQHFEWLVKKQVKNVSYGIIAKSCTIDNTSGSAARALYKSERTGVVSDAIESTMKLLFGEGWKLLMSQRTRARGGRPKKKK